MEVAKLFQNASLQVTINIRGTEDEPLFQANQIGRLLGITKIRDSIKDFDEDEKVAGTTGTLGGQQQTLFLTELGLYRLLGQSRKPVARPFQRWVGKVLKEIRITGKYDLERQRNESCLLLEESKREAEESKREAEESKREAEEAKKEAEEAKKETEEAKRKAEESVALAAAKDVELAKIRTKIYEELPKLDHVYVSKEVAELATDTHKVGKAVDPKKRESQLNTGSAQGTRMIYTCATHNAKIVEDIVKVAQRRYHIASIGGCEHYNNNVEHSVDVIDIAATVVDTMASSFEYMKRGALFRKVIANLQAIQGVGEVDDDDTILKESRVLEVANTRNKLHEFLAMDNDHRTSSSKTYSISRVPGSITWVSDFKRAFEDCMFTKLLLDAATLRAFGYRASGGRENVCKSCKGMAKSRGGRCCDVYDVSNRIKKEVIFDMMLTVSESP